MMKLPTFNSRRSVKGLALLLLFAGCLHFASFNIYDQPVITDIAFFLYFAARFAGGAVPYVDFIDFKTPLSVFAGALGHLIGGLTAIRLEYLLFAALAAAGTGLAHFYLANRRAQAAWMGLLAFCGFQLLGLMPSIGNMPKQLTMVCALFALLSANRGRWILAGALAVLAMMDWQPGGAMACLALLIMALLSPQRVRSLLRTLGGMAAGFLPFAAYFLVQGAFGSFLHLAFVAPLARPAAESPGSLGTRLERIQRVMNSDCPGEMWLIFLGFAGVLFFPILCYRLKRRKLCVFPLACGLGIYHLGVLAWTLSDFQSHGDLFIALGSLAFFAAVPLVGIYYIVARYTLRHRVIVAAVVFMALAAGVRPSFVKEGWRTGTPKGPIAYTLAEQQEVAEHLKQEMKGRALACLDYQELLFLSKVQDCLGFVYYDPVIHRYLSRGEEDRTETLLRCLEEADPHAVILPQRSRRQGLRQARIQKWLRSKHRPRRFSSKDGAYTLMVWCKTDS